MRKGVPGQGKFALFGRSPQLCIKVAYELKKVRVFYTLAPSFWATRTYRCLFSPSNTGIHTGEHGFESRNYGFFPATMS